MFSSARIVQVELLKLTKKDLEQWFEGIGEKPFRTAQVLAWVWQKSVTDPRQMTDLPETLRGRMLRELVFTPKVKDRIRSFDRSVKYLIEFSDGNLIESVLMKSSGHHTLCVSTQIGCPFSCLFCESGKGGLVRNLDTAEILAQVALCAPKPRNIVFMGIGEPLLNFNNLKEAITRLSDEAGISMRHMTVSTAGVPGMIERLAIELPKVKLAISLHAPTQKLRERLMPKAAKAMPIGKLIEEVKYYQQTTGNRPTYEYVMIDGVNDSVAQAEALSDLLLSAPGLVNLIPCNPTSTFQFEPSQPPNIRHFLNKLRELGMDATVRKSLGLGSDGACGQLRSRRMNE